MRAVFSEPEYSYSIEPLNHEDKIKVWANTWFQMKFYALIFLIITILLIVPLFFLQLSTEDLTRYLLIALCSLAVVQLATALMMVLYVKAALRRPNKIVEKGFITRQDTGGDSETINYTYIGKQAYRSLPGDIKIGDRIRVEHTLNKLNTKHIFIRAEKI